MSLMSFCPRFAFPPALFLLAAVACGPAPGPAPAPTKAPALAPRALDAASAVEAAALITPATVGHHVHALAHDSTLGRDTPSPELEKAALYLASHFQELGLEPGGDDGSFIQRWEYVRTVLDPEGTRVHVPGQAHPAPALGADYFLVPGMRPTTAATLFFAGTAGEVRAVPAEARGTFFVFDLPGSEPSPEWQEGIGAAMALSEGAAGLVFVLDPEFPRDILAQISSMTAGQQAPFPMLGMAEVPAAALFAAAGGDLVAARSGPPAPLGHGSVEVTTSRSREVHHPPNVAALVRGSDPALRNTYVVVTAHFDHVGVGPPDERGDSIFNGADDNASGTAGVLEMARAFTALPQAPARSVLFLAVSGEEKGLLGARAFVESPTLPLEGVVANINLDMIGRNAPDTVVAIGQEYSTLEQILQDVARRPGVGLAVVQDPEPEKMFFFRSDQLPFIQRRIPAVFLTTGDHEDYHRQSDRPENIDTEKLARVARLAFHLVLELAMDPEAPQWTEEGWLEVEMKLRPLGGPGG
jgi:hypothetical protein